MASPAAGADAGDVELLPLPLPLLARGDSCCLLWVVVKEDSTLAAVAVALDVLRYRCSAKSTLSSPPAWQRMRRSAIFSTESIRACFSCVAFRVLPDTARSSAAAPLTYGAAMLVPVSKPYVLLGNVLKTLHVASAGRGVRGESVACVVAAAQFV